jgi:C4-dicarboxylate-specific signal transduction histidine kinase
MAFDSNAGNSTADGEATRDFPWFFERLLQSRSEVFWAKDLATDKVLHVSDGARDVYGREPREFLDNRQLWLDVIHDEDRPAILGSLENLLHQGRLDLYYRIVRPDSSIRTLVDRLLLVRDPSGRPSHVVGMVSDISDYQWLDSQSREAHQNLARQLAERDAELAETRTQLAEESDQRRRYERRIQDHEAEIIHYHRLHTLGEMASGIAHELNQPLAAINNYAESCMELVHRGRSTDADVEFALSQVIELSGRAGEIIRRLRTLAKKREFRRSTLDVAAVAREAMSYVEREAQLAEVAIEFRIASPRGLVLADSLQLQQIFINLARNAVDALAEVPLQSKVITITVRNRSNGTVEFSVHNPGPPIPTETLRLIFEPFFTTKEEGLGMGLSICRRIIEAHGGSISAKSTVAGGTKIICRLPAVPEGLVDED